MQPLSNIQSAIIWRLKNAESLRYAELQQKGVPNDLFNYHLQFLVKKKLLAKRGSSYSLSTEGMKLVADPYTSDPSKNSFFKINVICIVSRKNKGKIEILNQIRKSHPSYGKVGAMGGVVEKGERTEDAAARKLRNETGLSAKFKLAGCERRLMYKGGELFSDVLFPIAYADASSGDLIADTEYGHNMWVSLDQAIRNESDPFDSIQGINTVLKALKKGKLKTLPYFYKEVVKDDSLLGKK